MLRIRALSIERDRVHVYRPNHHRLVENNMADLGRDQRLFNCGEDHEINYVADLYGVHNDDVRAFLKDACDSGTISNFTHAQVYQFIAKELHLPIPVDNPRG